MGRKNHHVKAKTAGGSLTVEAAIIIPIVLFSILWMVEKGIALYTETVELVQEQEMWEGFDPAGEFRKLKLLEKTLSHK